MNIIAQHSHYIIDDVDEIPNGLVYELSTYDKLYHRLNPIGFQYDEDRRELRIPRGYSESTIRNYFPTHKFIVDKTGFSKYDKIDVNLTAPPRDYMQEHMLTYMIGKPPYEYTAPHSQLYTSLDTGSGKTYCGIAAMCYYQCRTVVFTPSTNGKIGNQWVEAGTNFTTMTDKDILLVKGSKICEDIINGKHNDVKLFIIPRSTVVSFVRKYDDNWDLLTTLVDKMNVGQKIIDEGHENFSTIVKIDNYTNVKRTYYMSSSPQRSQFEENKIYKSIFYNVPKYGKQLKTMAQNHIKMLVIFFSHKPSYNQVKKIKTRLGPSQSLYGDYLISEDGAMEEFIEAYTFALYTLLPMRRDNRRILIICITKHFAEKLAKITKSYFPEYSIGLYIGSGKNKEKELENDIIFSTVKGFGTGADLGDRLQFIINTITYTSSVLSDQVPGRLRYIKNISTIYCELVNKAHQIAIDQYKTREKHLMKKAKDGKIITHDMSHSDLVQLDSFFNKGYWYDGNGLIRNKRGEYIIGKRKKS